MSFSILSPLQQYLIGMYPNQGLCPSISLVYNALDWIYANLDYFNPTQGEENSKALRLKASVELTILCLCLQRLPKFSRDVRIKSLLEFLLHIYTTPVFRAGLFRDKDAEAFVAYIFFFIVLDVCDLLDDHYERQVIQKFIESSNIQFIERHPRKVLELRHILDIGKFTHKLPSYEMLYKNSILSKSLNILYLTDRDAYSITHILFYLSDFGSHPIISLPPLDLEQAYKIVEQMLGMYIYVGNWDLTAELLLSCHCLKRTTSDFYALGWRALLSAQWSDGTVPGSFYDPEKGACLVDVKRQEYVFKQCYHTTLVAALAGALCPYV